MASKTILITGAAGGLGSAVTEAMLASGWRVVAPVRPGSAASNPTGSAASNPAGAGNGQPGDGQPGNGQPSGAEWVPADLTDPAAVAEAVAVAAGDPAAPLRAVANLAGGFMTGGRVHQTPITDLEKMIDLNLRPTYLVTAACLPHLIDGGGGAVVCVSTRAAKRPFAGAAGYVTAKAAVLAFANAVAVEYATVGVRCNTVLPGVIDTPANRAAMPGADRSTWAAPPEIARVIRFLASEESAPTTGAALPV